MIGEGVVLRLMCISNFPEYCTVLKPIEAFSDTRIVTLIQDRITII